MDPELAALQACIQALHHLMTVMDDPADVAVVSKALNMLTGLQQKLMQAAGPGAAMGGPGGPPGMPNPLIAALAARLGAGGPGGPPGLGPGGPPPGMMGPGGPPPGLALGGP
jgi:hypothetical protein